MFDVRSDPVLLPFDTRELNEKNFRKHARHMAINLDHQEQLTFLTSIESLDLQAAPGSGKTTLLALKLRLLAEHWASTEKGICVLSHTNTAKDQIIARLRQSPAARTLLRYPHFIAMPRSVV